jgi:phenylpropionate dioxygenase-like ring-hydroxylating dioxygenase large terminal subunit/glutathione S-transferase
MDPFSEIRACHEAGRVAPGLAYRDPEVYEAEVARIFRAGWISVACGQNVPNSGDLFPVRIAGQSLFVARDGEGRVQVFYNLCRHRGARLVGEPCNARGGRIACPYHGWSYGVDGKLKAAPHLHRGASQAASNPVETAAEMDRLGLFPVRSAVWRDIVFVDLSGDAEPFEDFLRPLAERLAHWTESELRPLCSDEYEIQANWKFAVENFVDIYHLPVLHSQSPGGFAGALATEDVEVSDDIIGIAMTQGYGEGSGQEEWSLPRFPDLSEDEQLRLEIFSIFPNTLLLVEPDCAQVIVLRPQSAGVTTETFANYVVSDASLVEALAEERAELRQQSLEINDQDAALLAGLQLTRTMDIGGETQPAEAWDTTPQRFQQIWGRRILARRRGVSHTSVPARAPTDRRNEEVPHVKHYCNPASRAVTTIWMLRELDVPHEEIVVDFAAGEQQSPEFRAINPMGKVPALVDGDTVVTEVAAICAYLADKFAEKGFAPPPGSTERAAYYRYLFVPGTTMEPVFALTALGIEHPNPGSAGWGDLARVMATVESMTPEAGWALGERFTAADVVFGGLLDSSVRFNLMEASPKVAAYVERIRARPAYQATHAGFGA